MVSKRRVLLHYEKQFVWVDKRWDPEKKKRGGTESR